MRLLAICFPIKQEATSVKETNKEIDSSFIYPNPTSYVINLQLSRTANYTAQIFNSAGMLVYSGIVNGKQSIDLTYLEKGVYIVTLKKDGKLLRQKLIKN